MRCLSLVFAALLWTAVPAAHGQTASEKGSTPAAGAATATLSLKDYDSCGFDDGLQVVKVDTLPPGEQQRTIDTTTGPKVIRMLAGQRILFAYGVGGNYFANVKPELLPGDTWAVEKQELLDEIQALVRSDFTTRPNGSLPPDMHGLEVHGMDRTDLKGATLGFYMLFDNARHIATGVYFLNPGDLLRNFQTIEQYRDMRTRFLQNYTTCIAQNRSLHSDASSAKDTR